MADPFGLSFSPTDQGGPAQNGKPSPIQQAIQTLSLRIPRVAGASAFTAQPLLNSAGGAALGGLDPNSAAVLEQLRRMLFGDSQPGPGGSPSLPGMGNGPSPMGPSLGAPPMGVPMGGGGGVPGGGTSAPTPNLYPGSQLPRDPDPGPPPMAPIPAAPAQPLFGSTPYSTPPEPRDRRL